MADAQSLKVFISYSWTTEAHKDWVVNLARRLMGDGVTVTLDRWDLQEGHDKFAFMEQMVTDAAVKKVLVVSDKRYAEKANVRVGGVGTESQIISAEVYNKVSQSKFIPVVRERDDKGEAYLPVFMASLKYIDFSTDDHYEESYEQLIRNIYDRPELKKPELGMPPAHIFRDDAVVVKTAGKFNRLREAVEKDRPHKEVVLRDYLVNLGDALEEMRITEVEDKVQRDELVLSRIELQRPYRDEFIELCLLYASNLDAEEAYQEIVGFLDRVVQMKHPSGEAGGHPDWYCDPYRFLGYEWVLYLISALIHHRKYDTAARFIGESYHYRSRRDEVLDSGIGEFSDYVESLEQHRQQRLSLRRLSLVADIIKQNATHKRILFRDLFQSDMVLALRPTIMNPERSLSWYPRLGGYGESGGTLELFARATTPRGLTAVKALFGARDAKDFARKVLAALSSKGVTECFRNERFVYRSLDEILCVRDLKRMLDPAV